jgi:hypothetical protein
MDRNFNPSFQTENLWLSKVFIFNKAFALGVHLSICKKVVLSASEERTIILTFNRFQNLKISWTILHIFDPNYLEILFHHFREEVVVKNNVSW